MVPRPPRNTLSPELQLLMVVVAAWFLVNTYWATREHENVTCIEFSTDGALLLRASDEALAVFEVAWIRFSNCHLPSLPSSRQTRNAWRRRCTTGGFSSTTWAPAVGTRLCPHTVSHSPRSRVRPRFALRVVRSAGESTTHSIATECRSSSGSKPQRELRRDLWRRRPADVDRAGGSGV